MQLSQSRSHSARGSNTFPLKRGVSRLARKPSKMQPRRVNPAWGTFELFGSDAHRVTPSAEKFCVSHRKSQKLTQALDLFLCMLRALHQKAMAAIHRSDTHTFK